MSISPFEIVDWNIYKIVSPSNRAYIGITCNLKNRLSCYTSNVTSKQTLVFNSIKKYGWDAHKFEVIDTFKGNINYAEGKEMFWIRSYMSNKNKYPEQNGLNLTDGGDGVRGYKATDEVREKNRQNKLGRKASEETKKKMSAAGKGRKMNFTHMTDEFKKMLSDKFKGKSNLSEEGRKKISESSKRMWANGRVVTEEMRARARVANLGKKASEETKKKLSEMRRGKKIKSGWTEEKKQKMREFKLANPHKHTEEAKRKISEAGKGNKYNVGRKHTEEWKIAMSKRMMGNKHNLGRKKIHL